MISDAMRREAEYWARNRPGFTADQILVAAQFAATTLSQPISRQLVSKVGQGPTGYSEIDWLCGNAGFLRVLRKDNKVSDKAREPKNKAWLEEARAVQARFQQFAPISVEAFCDQEHLAREKIRRQLAVVKLPPNVLLLLENDAITTMTALAIAVTDWPDEVKVGLALRAAEGKVPPKTKQKQKYEQRVRWMLVEFEGWEPETRHAFLTDNELSYEEASERDKLARAEKRRLRAGAKEARERAEAIPESALSHDIAGRIAAMARDLVQLRSMLRSTTADAGPSIMRNARTLMEVSASILEMGGEQNPLVSEVAVPTVVEGEIRRPMRALEAIVTKRTG